MSPKRVIPLVGAAVVTAGAIIFGILRLRPSPVAPANSASSPPPAEESFVERLRQQGF